MDPCTMQEKDWKLLQKLAPLALERFCGKVLRQAAGIANAPSGTSHERYLHLYKFIERQDQELASAFDDRRRSTALAKLARIYSLGLLTEEELGAFSEETRETILLLSRRPPSA